MASQCTDPQGAASQPRFARSRREQLINSSNAVYDSRPGRAAAALDAIPGFLGPKFLATMRLG
jgi:hypothetical protein